MKRGTELEQVIMGYVQDYVSRNRAARVVCDGLEALGIGIFPILDHITVRTLAIDERAQEFLRCGYVYAETLEYEDWWAKVYRAPGCPALFVDQGFDGERGKSSIIPGWVRTFGDRTLHHIAVRVEDIEESMHRLGAKGIQFAGTIVGERGGDLRQVFTVPEQVEGQGFSVLELAERHHGYAGFSPPQANSLMRSTVNS
ncbi:MAG: hypothetical protein R3B83_10190 [Nitrospirales bacterium]|nr:hypothetical protein [Nitrospirales bacterium]HQU28590.1 hypothetical protein [Nitrospirales bacterium]